MKSLLNGQKSSKVTKAILYGVVFSGVITVISALIGALLLAKQIVTEDQILVLAVGIWGISSFLGMMIAMRIENRNIIVTAGMSGLSYILILIAVSILLLNQNFRFLWQGIITIASSFLIVLLLSAGKKNSSKSKIKYKRK